jgi:hypothetical protein
MEDGEGVPEGEALGDLRGHLAVVEEPEVGEAVEAGLEVEGVLEAEPVVEEGGAHGEVAGPAVLQGVLAVRGPRGDVDAVELEHVAASAPALEGICMEKFYAKSTADEGADLEAEELVGLVLGEGLGADASVDHPGPAEVEEALVDEGAGGVLGEAAAGGEEGAVLQGRDRLVAVVEGLVDEAPGGARVQEADVAADQGEAAVHLAAPARPRAAGAEGLRVDLGAGGRGPDQRQGPGRELAGVARPD